VNTSGMTLHIRQVYFASISKNPSPKLWISITMCFEGIVFRPHLSELNWHNPALLFFFQSLREVTHTILSRQLSKHLPGPFDKQQNTTCADMALSPGLSSLPANIVQETLHTTWSLTHYYHRCFKNYF
jgi:hypothetical protein